MPHPIDPSSYRSPDQQRPAVPLPVEREPRTHDPYAAFRFGDFSSVYGREFTLDHRPIDARRGGGMGDLCPDPFGDCTWTCWLSYRRPGGYAFAASRPFGGSVQPQTTSSLSRRSLARLSSLALALVSWKHLSIPQFAPLREGNRALAAVAAIFERHHPIFHFDDASVPLIYLLLFIGASARTFSWAARSSFFPTLVSA